MPIALDIQADGASNTLTETLNAAQDLENDYTETDSGTNVSFPTSTTCTIAGSGSWNVNGIATTTAFDMTALDFIEIDFTHPAATPASCVLMGIAPAAALTVSTSQIAYFSSNSGNINLAYGGSSFDSGRNFTASKQYTMRMYAASGFNCSFIVTVQSSDDATYTNETLVGVCALDVATDEDETTFHVQIQANASGNTTTINSVKSGTIALAAAGGGGSMF